jgi:uncharacterized protein (TIGR01619 family)
MSDNWEYYPCQMGEHTAFVFYDHGLSETIEELSQPELLKVWLAFKETNEAGLPTGESFEELSAFEDDLTKAVEEASAVYVGRVTVNGNRVFYCYSESGEELLQPALQAIAERFGFAVEFEVAFDPEKDGYWKTLFPSPDDMQVMQDMKLLDVLAKHGDDGTTERLVEHWAYFPDEETAAAFRTWLEEEGYGLAEESDEGSADENNDVELQIEGLTEEPDEEELAAADDGAEGVEGDEAAEVCVRFAHEGPVTLPEITSHTIKLRRQATELQGNYDGWETILCKGEEAESEE